MALLQISEPGQSPDPHQRRIAVGIDLGTTHSLVAAVRNGVAECLPDGAGQGDPAVGGALPGRRRPPDRLRRAGRAGRGPGEHHRLGQALHGPRPGRHRQSREAAVPLRSTTSPGMVSLQTRAGEKSPVEISAEILATLRYRAEDTFSDDLYGAVITVPAYFDDAQRQATKDAAQAGRHQCAAADQRADRRGHRLRPGQRQRRHLRRLRPGRRHLRHLDPAPDARACSR